MGNIISLGEDEYFRALRGGDHGAPCQEIKIPRCEIMDSEEVVTGKTMV